MPIGYTMAMNNRPVHDVSHTPSPPSDAPSIASDSATRQIGLQWLDSRFLGWLGLSLLLIGIVVYVRFGMRAGVDFDDYYYPAGMRYLHGQSPYVLHGDPLQIAAAARGEIPPIVLTWYGGSPTTCALFAPFALLPHDAAKFVWLLCCVGAFSASMWLALSELLPSWSRSQRLLLLGVTACAGSLRWNGGQAQIEPLVVAGYGLVLYGEMRRKTGMILAGGWLTFLKLNAFPPLFCLLLLRGRYRLLAGILILVVAIDLLAAARLGVRATYAGNFLALINYAAPGTNNYPDAHAILQWIHNEPRPMVVSPGLVPNSSFNAAGADFLHWAFLISAFTGSMSAANLLGALCSLAALCLLGVLAWRTGRQRCSDEFTLRFFGASVCLGLLCISHLKYDVLMLIFPFFIALGRKPARPETLLSLTVCFLLAYAIPGGILMAWWLRHIVVPTNGVALVPLYSYLVTLAFAAALVSVWRYTNDGDTPSVDPTSSSSSTQVGS